MAFLLLVFPKDLAVLGYGLLGLAAVVTTLVTVAISSRSIVKGCLLSIGLALTSTAREFSLNGWDHIFSGSFLVIATSIQLRMRSSTTASLISMVLIFLGVLYRPDAAVIGMSLVVTLLITAHSVKLKFLMAFALATFGASFLILNFWQFGRFTPTTYRLKMGAVPSFDYVFQYFIVNGIFEFSAITFLLILLLFCSAEPIRHQTIPVALGTIFTAAIAVVNSDVFPAARMFWVPAAVLACVISRISFPFGWEPQFVNFSFKDLTRRISNRRIVPLLATGLLLGAHSIYGFAVQWDHASISREEIPTSRTAEHYVLAQWIDSELLPEDGAIGVFYAGTAFYLDRFEIADFLGKGDEFIAQTKVKWGPPGHNKWDIEGTIRKWNPQVIVPAVGYDPTESGVLSKAHKDLTQEIDYGFVSDLVINKDMRNRYSWCIPAQIQTNGTKLGLLIRRDVIEGLRDLSCPIWSNS